MLTSFNPFFHYFHFIYIFILSITKRLKFDCRLPRLMLEYDIVFG